MGEDRQTGSVSARVHTHLWGQERTVFTRSWLCWRLILEFQGWEKCVVSATESMVKLKPPQLTRAKSNFIVIRGKQYVLGTQHEPDQKSWLLQYLVLHKGVKGITTWLPGVEEESLWPVFLRAVLLSDLQILNNLSSHPQCWCYHSSSMSTALRKCVLSLILMPAPRFLSVLLC